MIVPIRQWTLLRPARRVIQAIKAQPTTAKVEKTEAKQGFMSQFQSMLEHNADLMLRS